MSVTNTSRKIVIGRRQVRNRDEVLSVEIKLEDQDGKLRLSIMGECRDQGGQMQDTIRAIAMHEHPEHPHNGWALLVAPSAIVRLCDLWDRWHLNDMRAGCEHQRSIDTTRKVEIVSYKLTSAALALRTETYQKAARAFMLGEPYEPTATARALWSIERWYADVFTPPDADSPLSGCYEVSKREEKAIGWVTQSEHQDGMLSRPCPNCGYKYGSSWLYEEIPPEIVAELRAWPHAPVQPPIERTRDTHAEWQARRGE